MRPFNIVKDEGFLTLMKTGRPGYAVPSPSTVARDVKVVFAKTRNRIAKMLRVCSNILFIHSTFSYLLIGTFRDTQLCY